MVLQGFTYQKDFGSHTSQSLRVPGFRGLNVLRVVVLKVSGFEGRRVLGFQGCRVLGFQGCRVLVLGLQGFTYRKDFGNHTSQSLRVPGFQSLNFSGV